MMSSLKELTKWWLPPVVLSVLRLFLRRKCRHASSHRTSENERTQHRAILSIRPMEELFPGSEVAEIRLSLIQARPQDHMVIPQLGLLALAALCKVREPRRIFEIGTYMGSATLAMAMNTPHEAEIFTLDVEPSARATHVHGLGVGGFADYVDADHSYDFVRKDKETAFGLLQPGGIIVWDDYLWDDRHPECAGVERCLNELSATKRLYLIANTRLAVHVDSGQI